jgi:hypothetical protein
MALDRIADGARVRGQQERREVNACRVERELRAHGPPGAEVRLRLRELRPSECDREGADACAGDEVAARELGHGRPMIRRERLASA